MAVRGSLSILVLFKIVNTGSLVIYIQIESGDEAWIF